MAEGFWAKYLQKLTEMGIDQKFQGHYLRHAKDFSQWVQYLNLEVDSDLVQRYMMECLSIEKNDWIRKQAFAAIEICIQLRNQLRTIPFKQTEAKPSPTQLLSTNEAKLRSGHYSARTIESYQHWTGQYLHFIASQDLEIHEDSVQAYFEFLTSKNMISKSTHRVIISALMFFFRFSLQRPFQVLDIPQVRATTRRIPEVLSVEEIRSLLSERFQDGWSLFFELLYGTGMRLSEIINLRLKDVDFARGVILIRGSKGDKDRSVLIPNKLIHRLKEHQEKRTEIYNRDIEQNLATVHLPMGLGRKMPYLNVSWDWQHFFGSSKPIFDKDLAVMTRGYVYEDTVRKALQNRAKKAGILKRVYPHILRHSYATHLLEAGISIRELQELLGHSKLETTMIYTHVKTQKVVQKSPLDLL